MIDGLLKVCMGCVQGNLVVFPRKSKSIVCSSFIICFFLSDSSDDLAVCV